MKRDTSLFSDEFKVETSNKVLDYDTSHIYTGHIYGKLDFYLTYYLIFFFLVFQDFFFYTQEYNDKYRQIAQKRFCKY
jgi:hypothetical protein